MPSQDKLFLKASVDSSNALTELFDFVWPTAVALWNQQWQAKGFLAQNPSVTVEEMNERFAAGSGIWGANLHRLATDKTWPEMQQWFARLLLSETCALFEGWIEAALDELAIPSAARKPLDKQLQFPSKFDASGAVVDGVQLAVKRVQGASGSVFMQTCFQPTQKLNKKLGLANLEALMKCYRAFKEVRNDFTHHGGRASAQAEQAFLNFDALSFANLGVKEKPELPPVSAGNDIQLSLRGVVGFSDIALRLIATLDYMLSDSDYAEPALRSRWKAAHGGLQTVKGAGAPRDQQLRKLVVSCGLPKPVNPTVLYHNLQRLRLVH
jgi:hypothetical protein